MALHCLSSMVSSALALGDCVQHCAAVAYSLNVDGRGVLIHMLFWLHKWKNSHQLRWERYGKGVCGSGQGFLNGIRMLGGEIWGGRGVVLA